MAQLGRSYNKKKSYLDAMKWYQLTAEQGNPVAKALLDDL